MSPCRQSCQEVGDGNEFQSKTAVKLTPGMFICILQVSRPNSTKRPTAVPTMYTILCTYYVLCLSCDVQVLQLAVSLVFEVLHLYTSGSTIYVRRVTALHGGLFTMKPSAGPGIDCMRCTTPWMLQWVLMVNDVASRTAGGHLVFLPRMGFTHQSLVLV